MVNVFHRRYEDSVISRNNEPGIFAISTDSRLFAYSYGDNTITIYLIESGLEVVSKIFDKICKIKFLEFIEDDKKLFIIGEDNESNVNLHIWFISGCLVDCSREKVGLSVSTLLKYEEYYRTLTKANGIIIGLNDLNDEETIFTLGISVIEKTTFGEGDIGTSEMIDVDPRVLEPWNNNFITTNKIYYYKKTYFLVTGQNSIQLWKRISTDSKDFSNFENLDLVYILIYDNNKFQMDDDNNDVNWMTTTMTSLSFKYFIERYPDNWKLMEAQYPLMAYLIYSRSFSLIKYILFDDKGHAKNLHRPQTKYISYPYYNYLKLYDDFKNNDDFKLNEEDLKSFNDLELALNFSQDQDAVMLAYLLEYYSENSMTHIGWMINVAKILPVLSKQYCANYMESLFYKRCFGGTKLCPLNKRFTVLPSSLKLKVYIPITWLIPAKSISFLRYKKLRNEELPNIFAVPFPNFTTYNSKIEKKPEGIIENFYYYILYWLREISYPHSYNNSNDGKINPFLQIKNKDAFFDVPVIEAVMTSKWIQTKRYWMIPLIYYIVFLFIFSFLSSLFLSDDKNKHNAKFMTMTGIFYYVGLYLLSIEIKQMWKYGSEYWNVFNMFDLCSILLGIIVFTLILVKSFNVSIKINNEGIVILTMITTLVLWIEMLLWLRLFTGVAIYIYIFGNILKVIIPFFVFMLVLCIGFGLSMFVLFGHPSLLNLDPSSSTFTLNSNGTKNLTLTGQSPDNPFDTIWDAILSAYNWNTINLNSYNYWPLKLFAFIGNVIIVLVLLNMIIALMNDTFNKAKEDGNLGLLKFRVELINDYERLDNPFFKFLYDEPSYVFFRRDPDLMKNWIEKSQKLEGTKLYSWFHESIDKEIVIFDDNIKDWYKFISGQDQPTQ
ncbi:hypothetical protein RclHR1_16410004 [Rhizophagus clarus]|nr:hypothetical protein RclHR1_16410004 [Rhizophagus clarus]